MSVRTVLKVNWIFFTLWSKDRNFAQYKNLIIALHWCPSHPFDHVPYNLDWFIDNDYIILFPNYYGTWGSDGQCDFDNCIDTINDLIDIIIYGTIKSNYDNQEIILKNMNIILFWASFGWHIALCTWALHPHIKNIIAFSPIVNRDTHNKEWDEADMWSLVNILQWTYHNLRRCTLQWLENLSHWKLKYSAENLLKYFDNKNILIIHWKNDPQVNWLKSEAFIKKLTDTFDNKNYEFQAIENKWHLLLHNCFESYLQEYVIKFLTKD